jgi:23S rRNA pseudouridine2605 synthase
MAERLQRYLARSGVASRRHAETLITAGRVTVNNQPATTLGTKVEPNDLVALDGKLVMPPDAVSWYVLYKPVGVVTTLDDPQGRPTVRGLLGAIPTRVFPIGRLDWDAEGALLLTDDGAAAHRLLHPSFQVPRTYLAKVKGTPTDESLARLVAGVRLEDGPARALEVERFQAVERNTWLKVTVGEGRPHLVKRLCAAIGHPVVRLFRPHQAGISVAGMQPGEIRALRPEELALLAAVGAGQPVPPMTLKLPARRHGRADEEEDSDGETETAPRPPKPPRFGTRAWRNSAAGGPSAGSRAPVPRGATGHGSGHSADGRSGAPPSSRPRPGRTDFAAGPKQHRGPLKPGRPFASSSGSRPPRAGEGSEGHGPRGRREFRMERPEGFRRDAPRGRPGLGAPGAGRRGDSNPRPTTGAGYRGKPADGRGGRRPGPSGAQQGSPQRGGRPEGASFHSRPGKPAGGRGGWTPRPAGARPAFGGGTPRAPGERFHARPTGGAGFRGKAASTRGGFKGGPPGAPSFERRRPPGRGAPPGGGPRGQHGTRGGGATGGGWSTKPPAAGGARHGGGRAFPGRGGRGSRPESRRGPPRPRGGAPRGPKR